MEEEAHELQIQPGRRLKCKGHFHIIDYPKHQNLDSSHNLLLSAAVMSHYASTVPVWIEYLSHFEGILKKGEAWAKENGKTDEEVFNARLHEDMMPYVLTMS